MKVSNCTEHQRQHGFGECLTGTKVSSVGLLAWMCECVDVSMHAFKGRDQYFTSGFKLHISYHIIYEVPVILRWYLFCKCFFFEKIVFDTDLNV